MQTRVVIEAGGWDGGGGGGGEGELADAMSESLAQALNWRLEANDDVMHRCVFCTV